MEEPVGIESVLDGGEYDIRIFLDVGSALLARLGRRAGHESPAVDPYDDRLPIRIRVVRSLPYVHIQAFLARRVKRSDLQGIHALMGDRPEVVRLVHTVIRAKLHWRLPAVLSDGLFADIGNSPVGDNVTLLLTDVRAVDARDRKGLVIVSVRDRFVLAVQCPHSCGCLLNMRS